MCGEGGALIRMILLSLGASSGGVRRPSHPPASGCRSAILCRCSLLRRGVGTNRALHHHADIPLAHFCARVGGGAAALSQA